MNRLTRISAILILILLIAVPAHAGVIILPSKDAFTDSANPTINESSDRTIHLKKTSTVEMQGFVQFDLAPIPTGINIEQIYEMNFKLFPSQVIHAGAIEVYVVNSAWEEGTLNHNNKPEILNKVMGTIPISASDTSIHVSVDLTEVMGMWFPTRSSNVGLRLKPVNDLDMYVRAKEMPHINTGKSVLSSALEF